MPLATPAVSEPPQVVVLVSTSEGKAANVGKLLHEWFPRINALLFDADHPLPYNVLMVRVAAKLKYPGVPAYADQDVIYLWSDYIARQDQADFEGMLIHEATHINQAARNVGENGWVVEGVADYVRHKYYAKDIAPTLRMTADGRLQGYPPEEIYLYTLQKDQVDLSTKGYQRRYTVASTFLYWLELRKDQKIVHEISVALEYGEFTPALFAKTCGKPLDALWDEFVAESKLSYQPR